jgi:hypothetical protein
MGGKAMQTVARIASVETCRLCLRVFELADSEHGSGEFRALEIVGIPNKSGAFAGKVSATLTTKERKQPQALL